MLGARAATSLPSLHVAGGLLMSTHIGVDIVPPRRQRIAGLVLFASGLYALSLVFNAPGVAVAVAVTGAVLLICAGMCLAIPRVALDGQGVHVRSASLRKSTLAWSDIERFVIEAQRPPIAVVLASGWPFPISFPTVTAIAVISDGRRIQLNALRSIRVPLLGYALTQTIDEVEGRLHVLADHAAA